MSVIPPAAREGGVLKALLAGGIAGRAERVLVGFNWTYVEGPEGAGLCQTPARGSAGCRSLPAPGSYRGRALAELAAYGERKVFVNRDWMGFVWILRDAGGSGAGGRWRKVFVNRAVWGRER